MGNTYDPKPPDQANAGPDLVKAGKPGGQSTAKTTGQLSPHPDAVPMTSGPVQRQATSDPDRVADLHMDLTGCADQKLVDDRQNLLFEIGDRVGGAATRWHQALVKIRMESLAKDDEGMGLVLDVLFSCVGFGVGPAIATVMKKLAAAADVTPERMKEVVGLISEPTMGWAKGVMADAKTNPDKTAVDALEDLPVQWAEDVRAGAAKLPLEELEVMKESYAGRYQTVDHFTAITQDLVSRYKAQVLPVGQLEGCMQHQSSLQGRVAHLWAADLNGEHFSRAAVVTHEGNVDEEYAYRFVTWIEEDMLPAAEARDQQLGEGTLNLDSANVVWSDEVKAWELSLRQHKEVL